jgi:hypothetical protein
VYTVRRVFSPALVVSTTLAVGPPAESENVAALPLVFLVSPYLPHLLPPGVVLFKILLYQVRILLPFAWSSFAVTRGRSSVFAPVQIDLGQWLTEFNLAAIRLCLTRSISPRGRVAVRLN